MKHIIQVRVFKGEKHYVAEGVDLSLVTQGETLDELVHNVEEAVALHLEGANFAELDLAPNPTVLLSFELPTNVHA